MALDCTTCGACCMNAAGIQVEEAERAGRPLSDKLIAEIIETDETRPMEQNAWCEWFIVTQASIDDGACGRCLYYDRRPEVCRDFEKGGAACLQARERAGLAGP